MSNWKHRALEAAADLAQQPPPMPAVQAQSWCNFIVWVPQALPGGCELLAETIRKEAPPGRIEGQLAGRSPWSEANPAAFRFEISDGNRRLRVKQFLYDWAFPALDHPCLWQSSTRARTLDPIDSRALDGEYVVWFGVDYLKNPAASARFDRTLIELSVLEGEFTEGELLLFFNSLRPVDFDAAADIGSTPFSKLSYWARHNDASTVTVPIGLWKFGRPEKEHHESWAKAPLVTAAESGLPVHLGDFQLDDLARHSIGDVTEWEAIFVSPGRRGRELRLIMQETAGGRISVPPEPSAHSGHHDTAVIDGVTVHLAWIDDRYGPFDAVWRDEQSQTEVKLLSTTGVGMDRAWFVSAVDDTIKQRRTATKASR